MEIILTYNDNFDEIVRLSALSKIINLSTYFISCKSSVLPRCFRETLSGIKRQIRSGWNRKYWFLCLDSKIKHVVAELYIKLDKKPDYISDPLFHVYSFTPTGLWGYEPRKVRGNEPPGLGAWLVGVWMIFSPFLNQSGLFLYFHIAPANPPGWYLWDHSVPNITIVLAGSFPLY